MKLDYNPKIDFRIIKFITYRKKYINKHVFYIKDLFKDLVSPKRKKDKKFILVRDIFNLLKKSRDIDISLIDKSYMLLNKNKSAKYKKDELKKLFDENNITDTFIKIIKDNIFSKNNFIMAVLILNYFRLNSNKLPIAFPLYKMKTLIKHCKNNNVKEVNKIIKECELTSIKLNRKHNEINLNKIINILEKHKDELINNFNIKHLYLFGSYVIGGSNEYSDIDIYVTTNNKLKSFILNKYFERIFGINIDLTIKEKRTRKYITKAIRKTMMKIF